MQPDNKNVGYSEPVQSWMYKVASLFKCGGERVQKKVFKKKNRATKTYLVM